LQLPSTKPVKAHAQRPLGDTTVSHETVETVLAHDDGRSKKDAALVVVEAAGDKIEMAAEDAASAGAAAQAIVCQTKSAWAAMTVGSCFTTKYWGFCVCLALVICVLFVQVVSMNKKFAREGAKVRALRAKLRSDTLAREEMERHEKHLRQVWSAPKDYKIAIVRDIKDRGCIELDFATRRVKLKRPLDFHQVRRPRAPLARFKRPDDALIVLGDVADLLRVFENAFVLIEGNTETALSEIDDWAMELAQERADLVKRTIEACGIEPGRLDAIGLPGIMGTNTHEVVLKIVKIDAI